MPQSEVMEKLKEIYGDAPEDILQKMIDIGKRYALDPTTIQMIAYDGDTGWGCKISRHGYRKIASEQPNYVTHGYYSLYKGDKVVINGDGVPTIELNNMHRDNGSLVGAIGYVVMTDNICIIRISYQDYCALKYAWDPIKGRPDAMLQKEAEVLAIRKAYAHLFWDSQTEETESPEEYQVGSDKRLDYLEYIKENQDYLDEPPKKALGKMTTQELKTLADKITKIKEKQQ